LTARPLGATDLGRRQTNTTTAAHCPKEGVLCARAAA
jgi:hypothetical protein